MVSLTHLMTRLQAAELKLQPIDGMAISGECPEPLRQFSQHIFRSHEDALESSGC